jgi:hypothetical protein
MTTEAPSKIRETTCVQTQRMSVGGNLPRYGQHRNRKCKLYACIWIGKIPWGAEKCVQEEEIKQYENEKSKGGMRRTGMREKMTNRYARKEKKR